MQLPFCVFSQDNTICKLGMFRTFLYFIQSILVIWWLKFAGFAQLAGIINKESLYFMLAQAFKQEQLLEYERL